MTRIYEALEQAHASLGGQPNVVGFPEDTSSTYSPTLIAKLRDLYRLIGKESTAEDGKLVQFIAARQGTGTSRISRALATICVNELGKRALIIDADTSAPTFPIMESSPYTPGQMLCCENSLWRTLATRSVEPGFTL